MALTNGVVRPSGGGGVWIGHRRLLLDAVFLPYVVLLGLRPATIRRFVPAGRVLAFLNSAVFPAPGAQPEEASRVPVTGTQLRWIAPGLVAIVLASVGMVHSSIVLASRWEYGATSSAWWCSRVSR